MTDVGVSLLYCTSLLSLSLIIHIILGWVGSVYLITFCCLVLCSATRSIALMPCMMLIIPQTMSLLLCNSTWIMNLLNLPVGFTAQGFHGWKLKVMIWCIIDFICQNIWLPSLFLTRPCCVEMFHAVILSMQKQLMCTLMSSRKCPHLGHFYCLGQF